MSGDLTSEARRDVLRALQRELSAALGAADTGQVAALSRELRAVVAEIEALGGTGTVKDSVDEVAAARALRRQAVQGGGAP